MSPLSDIKKAMEAGPVAWIRGSGLAMLRERQPATVFASEGSSNHSTPLYSLYAIDIAALLQHIEALEAKVELMRIAGGQLDVSTELPELPESHHQGILGRRFFDSDQMRAYALAASAPLQAQGAALEADKAMLDMVERVKPIIFTPWESGGDWYVCINPMAEDDCSDFHGPTLREAITAAMASAAQEG